jgi:excisionase family DNA binding protein
MRTPGNRIVVVLGAWSPEIDTSLRALGLEPLDDDSGDASVWVPAGRRTAAVTPVANAQPSAGPQLTTIADVAAALGVGRSTVYELIARGDLEVVHIGRAARVPARAVDDLVRRRLRGNSRVAAPSVSSCSDRLRVAGLSGASQP